MNKFFYKMDLFGKPIQFSIGADSKKKSNIGGIYSFISSILLSILFYGKSTEFITKNKPTGYYETKRINVPPLINYSLSDLYISFNLINSDSFLPINNLSSYFHFDFFNENSIRDENNFSSKIKTIKKTDCEVFESIYSNNDLNEMYYLNQISEGICLGNKIKHSHEPIMIGGSYGSRNYSVIRVKLDKCQSNQENSTCKSEEEISRILNKTIIQINILDNMIDYENYDFPQKKHFTSQFKRLSEQEHISTDIYLKNVRMITKDGFLFENKVENNFFSVDYSFDSIKNPKNTPFFQLEIKVSDIIDNYYRTYIKVEDICSKIGGFFKLIVMIGEILTFLPYKFLMYESLILNLLNIDIKEQINKQSIMISGNKNADEENPKTSNVMRNSHIANYPPSRNNLRSIDMEKLNLNNTLVRSFLKTKNSQINNKRVLDDLYVKKTKNLKKIDDDLIGKKNCSTLGNISFVNRDNSFNMDENTTSRNFYQGEKLKGYYLKNSDYFNDIENDFNNENKIKMEKRKMIDNSETIEYKNKLSSFDNSIVNPEIFSINDNEEEIKKLMSLIRKNNHKKFHFSLKDMISIEIKEFFHKYKLNQKISNKLDKLKKVSNYFDFFVLMKIMRDSVYLKNYILSEKERSYFKFFDAEISLKDNLDVKNNDVENIYYLSRNFNSSEIEYIKFLEKKDFMQKYITFYLKKYDKLE